MRKTMKDDVKFSYVRGQGVFVHHFVMTGLGCKARRLAFTSRRFHVEMV